MCSSSHYDFDLYFPAVTCDVEHIFTPFGHLCVYFGTCLFRFCAHFKIRLFSLCYWSVWVTHIFLILSDRWFEIFFPFHILPFHLIDFFSVQKLFGLMQSHFLVFAFVSCILGITSKNSSPRPISWIFPSIFNRSFMISCLTFQPLIHL